jgi:hypothetical protein
MRQMLCSQLGEVQQGCNTCTPYMYIPIHVSASRENERVPDARMGQRKG